MRPYELMVLLHPDLEIDADAPIAKLEKMIAATGGKVTKRDNMGKKRLAYPVNKQNFAVYIYFELLMEPTKVRDLESSLGIAEEVMRFLTVHKLQNAPKSEKVRKDKEQEPVATAVEGEK